MSSTQAPIPIIKSIADLAGSADAWICDIWGVLHNGADAFAPAAAACRKFRSGGGVVVLLTNAPRPHGSVIEQMRGLGVPDDAYDAVVTSGDLTRRLITKHAGVPLFHLGPSRDLSIFDGLGVTFAGAAEAPFVVCSGFYDDDVESPADYVEMLAGFKLNEALMVCANPDLVVERGDRIVYCAGAMAEAYEKIGGRVIYAGKPHLPAYDMAFDHIKRLTGRDVPTSRVLAIGDSLRTDMKGAANAGLRAVFVSSAIHVKGVLDQATLDKLFLADQPRPVAAMTGLAP